MSYGSNHSAGVAILKGTFKGKVINSKTNKFGRWIILVIEVNSELFILGNMYATNSSTHNKDLFQEFEEEVLLTLEKFGDAKLIFGGDFNSVRDCNMDRFPHRAVTSNPPEFNNLCLGLDVLDIWRQRNPDKRQFTWCSKDMNKQSRIDFWLISSILEKRVTEVSIESSVLTDHKAIYLTLNLTETTEAKKNKSYWKFNKTLLEDDLFKNEAKLIIDECWVNANINNSYGTCWEFMKYKIRRLAIKRGKEIAKLRKLEEEILIKDIINLSGKEDLCHQEKNSLLQLQLELDRIYESKAKGAFVRSRMKWLEEGEKNTKYFFNLEKRNAELTTIAKLKINEQISENMKDITTYITDFYKKLYTREENTKDLPSFFNSIKEKARRITMNSMEMCDNDISKEEIKKGINRLKENKSPGNDGLIGEFYKAFQDELSHFLLLVFREAIEFGKLPTSMCQGVISLIPKPNKDALILDNWRPITLINNDAKLFATVFAERLKKCLDSIIDDCQSGFMRGRHICNNIRLVLDLIDYSDFIDDDSFILFVDFYKAFDRVEHDFMLETLDFFGFGEYFKRVIQTLYNGCNSSIKLANGTTPRFPIGRGIKQGCPISPFLFLLVTQTMALHIENNTFRGIQTLDKELKCCQLADDTTIFLKDRTETKKAIDCLNEFSFVSGLSLNIKKCELFSLKDCDLDEINGIPVKKVITYLGIKICKNEIDRGNLNFPPIIEKMKKRFDMWLLRDLSLNGRVLLSKTEGLSRLVYNALALEVPQKHIQEVDVKLFNFIWRNKPHYIKKNVLCNPHDNGGLNVLDFRSSNTVFKVKWVKNYIQYKDKIWNVIPNLIFEKMGGIEFLLKCNFDVNKIPVKLSNFHKQVLLSWINVYKHNFSPHKCIIWNNKDIRFKNKSFFFKSWYDNGILLVRQLFNENGNLFNYIEFLNRYNIPVTMKEFAIVFDAIPTGLISLLRGDISLGMDGTLTPGLLLNGIYITDKKCSNGFIRKMCTEITFPRAKMYWNSNYKNINWKEVWSMPRKYCLTNKIK